MSPKYKVGSMILDMPESPQTRRSPFINGKSDILEVSSCNPKSTINDDIILKNQRDPSMININIINKSENKFPKSESYGNMSVAVEINQILQSPRF